MPDPDDLNEHGFRKPETVQQPPPPDTKFRPNPFSPTAFVANGEPGKELTPKQFVSSVGEIEIHAEDWTVEGEPITMRGFACFGDAVLRAVRK